MNSLRSITQCLFIASLTAVSVLAEPPVNLATANLEWEPIQSIEHEISRDSIVVRQHKSGITVGVVRRYEKPGDKASALALVSNYVKPNNGLAPYYYVDFTHRDGSSVRQFISGAPVSIFIFRQSGNKEALLIQSASANQTLGFFPFLEDGGLNLKPSNAELQAWSKHVETSK